MNSRIRLFDNGSGRFQNTTPIIATDSTHYTVSISKDFTDVQILDGNNVVVGQFQGTDSHTSILQAVKNFLINLNCVFSSDNNQRASEAVTVVAPAVVDLEFSSIPTSGQLILNYGPTALGAIQSNAIASNVQAVLNALPALNRVVTSGNFTSEFITSMVGVPSPLAFSQNSNTLQIDSVQLIQFSAVPDAGHFTVAYNGNNSASIAFNATATAVQSALRGVTGLSAVVVTGNYASGFSVKMVQITSPTALSEDTNNLTTAGGALTPVTTTFSETTPYAAVTLTIEQ